MPYKIFNEDGEFCVYKHNADGEKVGNRLGCHPTEDAAREQMSAIYANEKSVTRKAIGVIKSLLSIVDEDDRQEPEALIPTASDPEPVVVPELTKDRPVAFWKGKNDQWMWLARYSDSFRDDDWPVKEIVSSASHKFSIEMIDKGVYPMPELWLWHEPLWKWGQATVVAYDEVAPGMGFAMAGGVVDKGKEWIAEAISKSNHVRVSHGMPIPYVSRYPDDPTIIAKHMTYEISPLPSKRAAIQRTGFVTFTKGVDQMAVTDKKRTEMAEALGVTTDQLKSLEGQNADIAKQAAEAGTQSKEKSDPPEGSQGNEGVQDKDKGQDKGGNEEKGTPEYITADALSVVTQDIVKGFGEIVGPLVKQVGDLTKQVADMQAQQSKERQETTPAASLYAQLMASVTKAAGDAPDDEEEDPDQKKEKTPKGPVETKQKAPGEGETFSPFINGLIQSSRQNRVGFYNMANGGHGDA